MLKRIGITGALLACAALLPLTASAEERHDRGGYATWNDRGRDHRDGNWNHDRRDYTDYRRGEGWRDSGRVDNRYNRGYYSTVSPYYYSGAPYAYGYDYSTPARCR